MADPRSKELNMLDGPILPRILQFTLPLAATGMLQLLFNAADVIVVGKFSGSIALAAVGATSTLVNLIVNTFIGISVGVNILVARRIGCHDADGVKMLKDLYRLAIDKKYDFYSYGDAMLIL